MFFRFSLIKVIYVTPAHLTSAVMRHLEDYLRIAVEGKRVEEGLIVAVTDMAVPNPGKILDNGNVSFTVHYDALVFKVFPGEVMDVIVTQVDRDGITAAAGAMRIRISKLNISNQYIFETDNTTVSLFVMKDGSKTVRNGDTIRVKIINEMTTSDMYDALASMVGEYFGPRQ